MPGVKILIGARVLGGMDAFAYGFDNPYASYKEIAPENWLTDQQLGALEAGYRDEAAAAAKKESDAKKPGNGKKNKVPGEKRGTPVNTTGVYSALSKDVQGELFQNAIAYNKKQNVVPQIKAGLLPNTRSTLTKYGLLETNNRTHQSIYTMKKSLNEEKKARGGNNTDLHGKNIQNKMLMNNRR